MNICGTKILRVTLLLGCMQGVDAAQKGVNAQSIVRVQEEDAIVACKKRVGAEYERLKTAYLAKDPVSKSPLMHNYNNCKMLHQLIERCGSLEVSIRQLVADDACKQSSVHLAALKKIMNEVPAAAVNLADTEAVVHLEKYKEWMLESLKQVAVLNKNLGIASVNAVVSDEDSAGESSDSLGEGGSSGD